MPILACNAILGIEDLPAEAVDAGVDAAEAAVEPRVDSGVADAIADVVEEDAPPLPPECDVRNEFGEPEIVPSLSTTEDEGSARFSDDELTVYIDAQRGTSSTPWSILTATRASRDLPFPTPIEVVGVQSTDFQYSPTVRADGLGILFERNTSSDGATRLYGATRAKKTDSFGMPFLLANVNSGDYTAQPFSRGDATEIWYVNAQQSHPAINLATRGPGGYTTEVVANVNDATFRQGAPVISADGLALYFASDKPISGSTDLNIWVTTRPSKSAPFVTPVPVTVLNTPQIDKPSWISPDGCRLYLASTRPNGVGKQDIYVAKRPL